GVPSWRATIIAKCWSISGWLADSPSPLRGSCINFSSLSQDLLEFLFCAARFTAGGSMTEPGKSWASSALITTETASLGGVSGGVIKSGVVFGVGGITSDGWMKNPGAATGLEGTAL
ncbi:mCG146329, partial [Mus musculus]